MLDAMRRGALNLFAKVLLGLLIIAFAVWGVADVFRGYGRGTLARIGDTEISVDQYRQAYQDEMNALSRRMGRRLTPEQAKLLGVEQRALSRLIGTAAIDNHVRDLGLALSDQGIATLIREDPAFQDPPGTFSNRVFQNFLRQSGNSEARYVDMRRKEEERDLLTDSLLAGLTPAQEMIRQLHAYRGETRIIEHFMPDYDKLIKVAEPDEAKLREYYDQNKRQFMTPELRKVNVLLLTREEVKAKVSVTDEEIKAAYEQDKEKFSIAEKRRIQQLAFPDKAAAEKAYDELSKAKNFAEAAAKLGFKDSDIDLGLVARRDLIDAKIADVTFGLKQGELSKPVEGQFAIVLVRVSEIVPGKQRQLAEVEGEIRDRIAGERATKEIQTLHDNVEDQRASGKPLKEIAESVHLPYRELPEITRDAKTADGKPAFGETEGATVARATFDASAGVETEAVDLPDGGYAWVDVLGVTPAKQKPMEEVKAEVLAAATELERRKEIANLASKLAERAGGGESFEALAKEAGAKVDKTNAITRVTVPTGLTQNAVQQAFALAKGGATSATTADGKARTVLKVVDVIPAPAATPEQTERLKLELTRAQQTDILAEYINGLQARYGLKINEAELKQALGAERDQPDYQ